MTDVLSLVLTEDFLVKALLSGVLLSLSCALLGVSLVLKRFSMIGDGLSHIGFSALAIASAAGVAPLKVALPVVVVAAFLLLRINESGKIKGDTAIALVSTGALAVGVMATSLTSGMNIDIYNYMFGSILTVTENDLILCAVLAALVIVISAVCYYEIFACSFDENFAKATGTKTTVYNMFVAILTAVTVVVGMKMMGALLISSLIIFPAVISMRVAKSYKGVVITSVVVSVLCFVIGLLSSVKFEAPVGASVVCTNILCLLLFSFLGKILSFKSERISSSAKRIFAFAVTASFAVGVCALLFSSEIKVYEKNKLSVVTTNFAYYDFAKVISGNEAEVTMLLSPGEESHTFEPTFRDIQNVKNADIFIYNGGESETWAETILSSAEKTNCTVIKMMDVTKNLHIAEPEEEHHHSHEHEEYDEHVWTSLENAEKICAKITEAMCLKDRANASEYSGNYEEYKKELSALSEKFEILSEEAEEKTFIIADRFPLLYLFEEFFLSYESAFPGCSAQAEVNPVKLSYLSEKIRSENISTIYKVDLSAGTVAKSLSESTGAAVENLYSCHTVSKEDFDKGETYISLMSKNYEALAKALY